MNRIWLLSLLLCSACPVMAESDYRPFVCAHEKDHLPPQDKEADVWFKKAVVLTKQQYVLPGNVWPEILDLDQ